MSKRDDDTLPLEDYRRMTEPERIAFWNAKRAIVLSNNIGCAVIILGLFVLLGFVQWLHAWAALGGVK